MGLILHIVGKSIEMDRTNHSLLGYVHVHALGAWALGISASEETQEQNTVFLLWPTRSVAFLNTKLNIYREYG